MEGISTLVEFHFLNILGPKSFPPSTLRPPPLSLIWLWAEIGSLNLNRLQEAVTSWT